MTTPGNAADIAYLSTIIGQDAVALIDTGCSVAVGYVLLQAVRNFADRPVRSIINTHEHPDHMFGNAAMLSGVTCSTTPAFSELEWQ